LHLTAVRPWLLLYNDPPGTFTLTLKDGSDTLDSKDFTVAELKAGAGFNDNEYHKGFFKIDLNAILHHDRTYTLELTSSGYSFSGTSYLGWIKEFERSTNSFSDSIWTFHQIWVGLKSLNAQPILFRIPFGRFIKNHLVINYGVIHESSFGF
jgi:hypothetical protein